MVTERVYSVSGQTICPLKVWTISSKTVWKVWMTKVEHQGYARHSANLFLSKYGEKRTGIGVESIYKVENHESLAGCH